jgi:cell division protein ZapA
VPEVNVEIAGKKYRMACEEGQEQHLLDLADEFNRRIGTFKDGFGEIGDSRLVVMTGIAALDELVEAHSRIDQLSEEIANLTSLQHRLTREAETIEQRYAERLAEAARRVEAIAAGIEEATSPPAGE